ncbi:MAG: DMT family transporter [Bosea sp. (in: a-proteobacteria)]
MQRETLGMLLGLVGVIVFGGTLPMTRLAVAEISPVFVTFARPALAGLLAAGVLLALRKPLPERRLFWPMFIASAALVWGFPGFSNFAMKLIPSAHGGIVAGILPLATAVAAAIVLHERPPAVFWVVALAGAALVTGFAMRDSGGALSSGHGLMLLAVAVCAVGYVYAGRLSKGMPGWEVISWMLVMALPLSLPGMWLTWPPKLTSVGWPALGGFVYITLLSQYLGFFAWNAGLAMGGVARVSQVQLLQSFVTLSFAAFLLGEQVAPSTWIVAAAVVGLVVAARKVASAPKS